MRDTFFKIGIYLLFLTAVGHFYNFANGDISIPVIDKDSKELRDLMQSYKIDRYGAMRTMRQTLDGFVLTWGFFIIFMGMINKFVLDYGKDNAAFIRAVSIGNVITFAASSVVAVWMWSLPVTVMHIATTLAFTLSLLSKK